MFWSAIRKLHIRELLAGKVCPADFSLLASPGDSLRKPQNVADLTFGEYVRLFQHPRIWGKLDLKIDGPALTAMLEEIRIIRNDVMHFDPDPMTEEELTTLKRGRRFMQELFELLRKN